jgi:membrane protein YdbS with pleckstrin-like domain
MLYENLEIKSEELPNLLSLEFESHPRRYLRFRLWSWTIFFLILLVPVIVLTIAAVPVVNYIAAGLWIMVVGFALIAEFQSFPRRGYLLRERDISYRKGWIYRESISIPYNRIQHSEVSQGPMERAMKLSTLKVFTAGGSGSDLSIHGLEPDQAERLKTWITEKTSQHV